MGEAVRNSILFTNQSSVLLSIVVASNTALHPTRRVGAILGTCAILTVVPVYRSYHRRAAEGSPLGGAWAARGRADPIRRAGVIRCRRRWVPAFVVGGMGCGAGVSGCRRRCSGAAAWSPCQFRTACGRGCRSRPPRPTVVRHLPWCGAGGGGCRR